MPSDEPSQDVSEAQTDTNPPTLPTMQPISLQPFTLIRLNDILPTEIVARRFPVAVDNPSMQMNVQFNIVEINVDPESLQAQVILEVKIEPSEEPHFFEMFFKLVALFSYGSEYTQEMVGQFLQQGSLSLMIPFARELILNLSTRLRMPPIVLSLIQLAPPSTPETK